MRALVANDFLVAASTPQALEAGRHERHVICEYTPDSEDRKEVERVREVLRAARFEERLQFKRDADTLVGIERFVYDS